MGSSVDRLVGRARRGDRVATGRLLMLYDLRLRRRIGRKISAELQGLLSPEDVLQETYSAAYRHIPRLKPREGQAFYNWLAAIADRKLLDAVKTHHAAKRSPRPNARRIAVDRLSSFLGLARLIDRRNKTPSKVVARREAVRAMQVAMASLPELCRQAVWMRHIEGKPVREIAAFLGRTERAVHQLCYRGLMQLRKQMGSRSEFLNDSR